MTKEFLPLNFLNTTNSNSSNISGSINNINISNEQMKQTNRPKFYCPEVTVDEQFEDNDENKIIEESPNNRWCKLDTEIFVQKLIDFDSAYLAIDTEKGFEIAWNEMKYIKNLRSNNYMNRFDNEQTLKCIHEKLSKILNLLITLEHPNILKFYDYWFTENEEESKLVVITEYSSAGSLKKLLDSSKSSQTKIKPQTYKRWLNQIIHSIKCLHDDNISIFQGHLNSETIFIQNSGVIKLSPTLLSLNGICEVSNNLIKCSNNKKPNIELNKEITIKDLHAIGRLALEIFNAHIKLISQTPTSPSSTSNKNHRPSIQSSFDMLNHMLYDDLNLIEENLLFNNLLHLDDELQKDFVIKCFEEGDNVNIESIWYHPFINNIPSLKLMSVYSILNYFQDKKRKLSNENNLSQNKEENMTGNSNIKTPNSTMINLTPTPVRKSSSNSSLTKTNSQNQLKMNNFAHDRRKVSLTFLTQYNNLKIPQDFFGILEDIRTGIYPRLFKNNSNSKNFKLKTISSSSCIDFVLQQKQILDRRSSFNLNSNLNNSSLINKITSIENFENELFEEEIEFSLDNLIDERLIKYPIEARRILKENCWIKANKEYRNLIELTIDLVFNDGSTRCLTSNFPISILNYFKCDQDNNKKKENDLDLSLNNNNNNNYNQDRELLNLLAYNENRPETKLENISSHLANELIDQGLINPNDRDLVLNLLLKTINEYLNHP